MKKEFWSEKRVLLTGHTGFKGSWLSIWLQKMGATVVGYALQPPTNPSLYQTAQLEVGMTSVIGDIRNYHSLFEAVDKYKPEIVFHMAAQPLVRYSYDYPVETYATNVMGTVHLLEAVRQVRCARVVVNITSDKCYENREWIWGYRESEPMGGFDPYSNSKGCAELVTSAYRSSFFNTEEYDMHGVALATARAGNVIGGGDWAQDRLVPDVLSSFSKGKRVVIRNPNAIRPWQHVLEPLHGYLILAENLWNHGPEFCEGWNFGPREEDARPVEWVVDSLAKKWGDGASWELDCESNPHEARYLKLDCSKAKSRLGWKPRWDLEYALEQVVTWHRAFNEKRDLRQLCELQISEYMDTEI